MLVRAGRIPAHCGEAELSGAAPVRVDACEQMEISSERRFCFCWNGACVGRAARCKEIPSQRSSRILRRFRCSNHDRRYAG